MNQPIWSTTNFEIGKKEIKEKNLIAFIVNSHFFNSDYQGKDWEAVRKSLVLELKSYFDQEKQKLIEEIEKLEKELNEIRGENKELDDAFPVIQKIFKRIYLLK